MVNIGGLSFQWPFQESNFEVATSHESLSMFRSNPTDVPIFSYARNGCHRIKSMGSSGSD